MTSFAVHLFGGFELTRDGAPVDVPLSSQRLLGFLGVQDRPVPRGYVAASLWPDTTDEKAAANLRTALWRLHRLDTGLLVAANACLALGADVWVDARVLRRAVRDHRRDGTLPPGDLLPGLRGELLPGCWDCWLVFERELLREEATQLCEAACAAALASGEINRAVFLALAAVRGDPLRESANACLVRAHLAGGNRAAAVRHARAYAALVRDELGIEVDALVA